jgi:hypothetical protein
MHWHPHASHGDRDHGASCSPASPVIFYNRVGPDRLQELMRGRVPSSWRFSGPSMHGEAVISHWEGCAKPCARIVGQIAQRISLYYDVFKLSPSAFFRSRLRLSFLCTIFSSHPFSFSLFQQHFWPLYIPPGSFLM